MARANKFDSARNQFQKDKASSMELVNDMRDILAREDSSSLKSKNRARIEQIAEVAFLKLMISWEVFIERTLVLYLMGEEAGNGHRPDLLIGSVSDKEKAYRLLSGRFDFNTEKNYLPYLLNPNEMMKVVNFFFGKHSYKVIERQSDFIRYARYIRNHIAHNSPSSRANFKKATNYFMGEGYRGTVGKFLMEPVKTEFSDYMDDQGWTHFDAYSAFFVSLSLSIAPIGK